MVRLSSLGNMGEAVTRATNICYTVDSRSKAGPIKKYDWLKKTRLSVTNLPLFWTTIAQN